MFHSLLPLSYYHTFTYICTSIKYFEQSVRRDFFTVNRLWIPFTGVFTEGVKGTQRRFTGSKSLVFLLHVSGTPSLVQDTEIPWRSTGGTDISCPLPVTPYPNLRVSLTSSGPCQVSNKTSCLDWTGTFSWCNRRLNPVITGPLVTATETHCSMTTSTTLHDPKVDVKLSSRLF